MTRIKSNSPPFLEQMSGFLSRTERLVNAVDNESSFGNANDDDYEGCQSIRIYQIYGLIHTIPIRIQCQRRVGRAQPWILLQKPPSRRVVPTHADLLQPACVRLIPIAPRAVPRIDIGATAHQVAERIEHRRTLHWLANASRRRQVATPSPVLAHATTLQQVQPVHHRYPLVPAPHHSHTIGVSLYLSETTLQSAIRPLQPQRQTLCSSRVGYTTTDLTSHPSAVYSCRWNNAPS